eukprot:IDg14620t1
MNLEMLIARGAVQTPTSKAFVVHRAPREATESHTTDCAFYSLSSLSVRYFEYLGQRCNTLDQSRDAVAHPSSAVDEGCYLICSFRRRHFPGTFDTLREFSISTYREETLDAIHKPFFAVCMEDKFFSQAFRLLRSSLKHGSTDRWKCAPEFVSPEKVLFDAKTPLGMITPHFLYEFLARGNCQYPETKSIKANTVLTRKSFTSTSRCSIGQAPGIVAALTERRSTVTRNFD